MKMYLVATMSFLLGMSIASMLFTKHLQYRVEKLEAKILQHQLVVDTWTNLTKTNWGEDTED